MKSRELIAQYEHNTNPGPAFVAHSKMPMAPPMEHPVRFIAYYLPQFHPIPENDAWWGVGFTEWTNVTRALPRFRGHLQPRLPGDLGFYDLSTEKALRAQVEAAKRGGIFGFCIHDYWFAGKKVLEAPLRVLRDNPDIDIRFCLNWANENWTRTWDGSADAVLLAQSHSPEDDLLYAETLAEAFADERYIRINGRPLIMIYRPGVMPDARATVLRWREFFHARGLGDPYLVMPQAFGDDDPRSYGMDAAVGFPPHQVGWDLPDLSRRLRYFDSQFAGKTSSYQAMMEREMGSRPEQFRYFPGVTPGWDNEARRAGRGTSFIGSTPARYGAWLQDAAAYAYSGGETASERLVFINAWNEWAEGAILEPDRYFGWAYLHETRRVLEGILEKGSGMPPDRDCQPREFSARPTRANLLRNRGSSLGRRIARRTRAITRMT